MWPNVFLHCPPAVSFVLRFDLWYLLQINSAGCRSFSSAAHNAVGTLRTSLCENMYNGHKGYKDNHSKLHQSRHQNEGKEGHVKKEARSFLMFKYVFGCTYCLLYLNMLGLKYKIRFLTATKGWSPYNDEFEKQCWVLFSLVGENPKQLETMMQDPHSLPKMGLEY